MSKKKPFRQKRAVIYCPVYKVTWFAQRGGKADDAWKWFCKKTSLPYEFEEDVPERLGSFSYNTNYRDAVIWLKEDAGTSTIVHEVFHAVTRLAELLDMKITHMEDEAFAHYAGWLAGEIVRKLW